jgi:hypothetical protein
LRDRIQELVKRDRLLLAVALLEVVALEDSRDRELAGQAQQLREAERSEPLGVVAELRATLVEDAERLLDVRPRVRVDLLGRQGRPRGVAAGRVADECREVADDEHDRVPEILELAQFAKRDGVAEVQVGGRGIDTELRAQRPPDAKFAQQILFGHESGDAASDNMKLFLGCQHLESRPPRRWGCRSQAILS